MVPDDIAELCHRYHTEEVISPELMTTPVVITMTIQSCPIQFGFTLVGNSLDRCDCYKELFDTLGFVTCSIYNDKHHYWFGVLLLSLGVILIVSSLTLNIIPMHSR